ncbi:hypothetical protein [Sulfurimonas sp.]|uniref:hypothetical protein n=1 Tax=Sulfurimonas sp. TaxID=2022749 RepID=UPI0025DC9A56|nr:hypothetical protein [Sulfurimonas sp.]MBW6487528.1 hypothetical protein [Sulfurimonas sp.]
MQVDITKVGKVIQDFSNKCIEIKSKEGFSMWKQNYKSKEVFNRAFRKIDKKFSEELKRREKEQ